MAQTVKVNKLPPDVSKWMMTHIEPSLLAQTNERDLNYLRGESQITLRQLKDLSKSVRMPIGYFLVSTPPEEEFPVLEYRTIGSAVPNAPSRELIDTLSRLERMQAWIADERLRNGLDPLAIVGSLSMDISFTEAANQIRNELDLSPTWFQKPKDYAETFRSLREAIGALGVTVILDRYVWHSNNRQLSLKEFRALALCDMQAPIVFINTNDTIGAQIFSLLHELVHICLGDSDIFENPEAAYARTAVSPQERFCNGVAGELLVPAAEFPANWDAVKAGRTVIEICDYLTRHVYKCSMTVVARRALEAKLINSKDYEDVEQASIVFARAEAEQRKSKHKKDSGGPNQNVLTQHRLSRRFIEMVANSVDNGNTSYAEAFRLTGTTSQSFFGLVRLVRGEAR